MNSTPRFFLLSYRGGEGVTYVDVSYLKLVYVVNVNDCLKLKLSIGLRDAQATCNGK